MFRYLESLIDPFAPAPEAVPHNRFWPFVLGHLKPFRKVLAVVTVTGFLVAMVEAGLIFYAGRLAGWST